MRYLLGYDGGKQFANIYFTGDRAGCKRKMQNLLSTYIDAGFKMSSNYFEFYVVRMDFYEGTIFVSRFSFWIYEKFNRIFI